MEINMGEIIVVGVLVVVVDSCALLDSNDIVTMGHAYKRVTNKVRTTIMAIVFVIDVTILNLVVNVVSRMVNGVMD